MNTELSFVSLSCFSIKKQFHRDFESRAVMKEADYTITADFDLEKSFRGLDFSVVHGHHGYRIQSGYLPSSFSQFEVGNNQFEFNYGRLDDQNQRGYVLNANQSGDFLQGQLVVFKTEKSRLQKIENRLVKFWDDLNLNGKGNTAYQTLDHEGAHRFEVLSLIPGRCVFNTRPGEFSGSDLNRQLRAPEIRATLKKFTHSTY